MSGDAVWLDVLPSLAKFGPELTKNSVQAAKQAGAQSGKAWGQSFEGAAGDAGAQKAVTELEKASARTKKAVADQTTAIGKARAAQREAAAKVVDAEAKLAAARDTGDASKIEAAELRVAAARDRAESATRKFEQTEESLKAAHKEHKTVTGQLEAATKDLKEQNDKANQSASDSKSRWGGVSDALSTAKGKVADFGNSVGGFATKVAGAVGAAALFASAWGDALSTSQSSAQLQAEFDLTAAQSAKAGEIAGNLYADSYGESVGEVSDAVGAVIGSFRDLADASAPELEEVTAQAMSLAKVFDLDVSEAAVAAGRLVDVGFAGTATEALDLMAATLQQVPEALRGDVIDAANEYSGYLSELGYTGEQAMSMLVAASAGGTIAIDKTGDALKELSIRATDMSTTSVAAYEAAGLNAQDMAARFLQGGDTARGALDDLVAGLKGIEDPVERSNAAIALFGTPLEDLGVTEIPAFLDSLTGMSDGLGDVAGKAGDVDDIMAAAVDPVDSVKRSFMGMLADGVQPLVGPLQDFSAWARETPGVMQAVGVALGIVAVAWAAVTLAASPWLAIGVGIAAVIGGIVLAVNNWGTIVDWLREKWEPIAAWFSDKWNAIKDGIGAAWQTVQDKLAAGWDWINTHVFDPISAGVQWVSDRFTDAKDWISGAWQTVQDHLTAGWDWINVHVFDPLKAGLDAIGTAFDTTQAWIAEAWNKVKAAAAAPVNFVIETVYTNGIKATWDKIANAVGLTSLTLPTVSPIRFAQGGYAAATDFLPGYTPGRDVHRLIDPATGLRVDMSGGEGIIRPDALRALAASAGMGAKEWVERVNKTRGQGFATGGVFTPPDLRFAEGGFWDKVGGVVSNVGTWVKDVAANVAGFISDPVGTLTDLIAAPVRNLLSSIGGGTLGQIVSELPKNVVTALIDKVKSLVASWTASGEYTGPMVGGWVRPASGPVTSEYGARAGAFHAGIDIGTSGKTVAARAGQVVRTGWNTLTGRTGIGIILSHGAGDYTYYGHNPVGGVQVAAGQVVAAGQHVGYGGATGNATGNHLHFEVHRGGLGATVNPRTIGVFDSGGYLTPGQPSINLSTDPEPVLTGRQWDDISALAARGVGGQMDMNALVDALEDAFTHALSGARLDLRSTGLWNQLEAQLVLAMDRS